MQREVQTVPKVDRQTFKRHSKTDLLSLSREELELVSEIRFLNNLVVFEEIKLRFVWNLVMSMSFGMYRSKLNNLSRLKLILEY